MRMRTEKEMLDLILGVAQRDERVRVVGMNGSRTNENAPGDAFQDYDVVYVVTDMRGYLEDPSWVDVFGERIILQMPEAMEMFPPELGNWFSYLMLFADETRIDLLLVPLEELEMYLRDDKLIRILLDKDGRVPPMPPPTDKDYWTRKPTAKAYNDCSNEFWWLATYVVKGLCRKELLYAIDHLAMMRRMLFIMLSWEVSHSLGYSKNMGKSFKYLPGYLPRQVAQAVMQTFQTDSGDAVWRALWLCCELFSESGGRVAKLLGFPYPEYDKKVTPYLKRMSSSYIGELGV